MRHVDIDLVALAQALESSLEEFGARQNLDLRADAYGFGVERVSSLAREIGFATARVCPRHEGHNQLGNSPEDASIDWLVRAQRLSAQRFRGTVVNIKKVPKGTSVSYGGHYVTEHETVLALVTLGFADGLPRLDPVGGQMELGGVVADVAGRIAMDQCVLDIGDSPVNPGDIAIAWGGLVSIEQWCQWSARSIPALSAGIASRVKRHLRSNHD